MITVWNTTMLSEQGLDHNKSPKCIFALAEKYKYITLRLVGVKPDWLNVKRVPLVSLSLRRYECKAI